MPLNNVQPECYCTVTAEGTFGGWREVSLDGDGVVGPLSTERLNSYGSLLVRLNFNLSSVWKERFKKDTNVSNTQ